MISYTNVANISYYYLCLCLLNLFCIVLYLGVILTDFCAKTISFKEVKYNLPTTLYC